MPELEKLMEDIDLRKNANPEKFDKDLKDKDAPVLKPVHFEFRLWLTTAPSDVKNIYFSEPKYREIDKI